MQERAWLLAACALAAALRLPALRWGPISDDEAIYDAMARVLVRGGVLYRDAVDHKPPGLAWTYALFHRLADGVSPDGALALALVHALGAAVAVSTCLALYGLAKRTLPSSLAIWPPLLYAVVSAAKQPADGLAVNGELLLNLPATLCALCALRARAPGRGRGEQLCLDGLAGALGAIAGLYKYQGAVVLFALPALWMRGEARGRALAPALATAAGATLPVAAAFAYFAGHGAVHDALFWGINFNRTYIGQGASPLWALERLGLQLGGVVLPGAILYLSGIAALCRLLLRGAGGDPAVEARPFLCAWTLLSLASVALGGRFFGHYFLQAEVPLSLLAAGPAARLWERRKGLAAAALGAPAAVFFAFAALPELSRPVFHSRDPDVARIGRAVADRTGPEETIWVWGNVPQLYHASARAPGVRFSFCNYLTGLSPGTPSEYDPDVDPRAQALSWAWGLALDDLEKKRPALVLDTAAAGIKSYGKFPIAIYPELAGYLAAHYRKEESVDGVVLYRRAR